MAVSIPALAQSGNNGGFEFLNLTVILSTLILSYEYLRKPEPLRLSSLCITGVLLAQTCYESGLFIGAVGCIAILGRIRADRVFTPLPGF